MFGFPKCIGAYYIRTDCLLCLGLTVIHKTHIALYYQQDDLNTWQLLNKHSNSLKPWGSFLFRSMNSFSFTLAQNANAESLWSECIRDGLQDRESPRIGVFVWFFSVKMPLAAEVHIEKEKVTILNKEIRQGWRCLLISLLKLKGFPLQPSLCYNILFLLWAKWLSGQLQPFFLAGRYVPRSWQAAHIMWLVLITEDRRWCSLLQLLLMRCIDFCFCFHNQVRL